MADRRRKTLGRSSSTDSTEYSISMGKSMRKKKPKERWLLTRKTWRYMADAGRKLIPDGAQNRPEDIPKIEEYFQEVCKKEPRFLLWRKNSYPGALGFRKKRKHPAKGGSCRKAVSADEVDILKPQRPKDLAIHPLTGGKFDIRQMKEDFLNKPPTPTDYSKIGSGGSGSGAASSSSQAAELEEQKQLVRMLEQYLHLAEKSPGAAAGKQQQRSEFNYQELVDKLQRHLALASHYANLGGSSTTPSYMGPSGSTSVGGYSSHYHPHQQHVHFQGDHVQKSLSETLSRYFSQSSNRDKIISDLLTDRKALEKLYFELRKTKGFRGSRGGTGYTTKFAYGPQRSNYEGAKGLKSIRENKQDVTSSSHPPPLIEVQSETFELTYHDWGTQTLPIPEKVLLKVEEEYKKAQAEKEEEERDNRPFRRRSSVDNDDISQSVSDTIKRYLRMARKKSVDTDKQGDRFKRVNYDRNLRNIKAKGEITKPGDDDGLNKGCQTNDDWILTYRDLQFDQYYDMSDAEGESRVSSSRSSIDVGVDDGVKSNPSSPPPTKSSSHSFLSHLLHGKHDKHDKNDKSAATTASAGAMQKSKSSSSVMHHGSRLVAKKIFRSRSKSQTRPPVTPCSWTPQGDGTWNSVTGRQVHLTDTNLLHLTEIERKVLQKVAIAKLQALNLGVAVKLPTETAVGVTAKPKRRPYLLKRKALTTGIFDTSRKDAEKDKDSPNSGGLVFGIPLTQCVENDRISRAAASLSPFRSRGELAGAAEEQATMGGRRGSRTSFSSLTEPSRGGNDLNSGSCDSLMSRERILGSVPGMLDSLSCESTADIHATVLDDEAASVPNILTECIRHLEQYGLHTLGIFRVSTSKKRIRQLREDFDCGKETSLNEDQCPHDVATLLKEYLRDLPDPLLCRDLYHAFVQTQKIRNRKLQFEALQHLIQLLPPANRDTLFALLAFLANVARNSGDSTSPTGEEVLGNKMDSNNLATVFAPNILHCIRPGSKDSERPEDRIDIINVVRTLIDHFRQLYIVSAELLDEVYIHMMDTHPDVLDVLLNKRDAQTAADESVDELDSESNSAPWTPTMPTAEMSIENLIQQAEAEGGYPSEPKKTYSREEFLHEAAATGGPDVGMRIRYKDRIRERSNRRRRDESSTRRRRGDEDNSASAGGISSAFNVISRMRQKPADDYHYSKNRSSSLESSSSTHTDSDLNRVMRMSDEQDAQRRKSSPYLLDNNGVITASLTIPVQPHQQSLSYAEDDIPFIEDDGKQQMTLGILKSPTAPPRRRQASVGSDSSVASSSVVPITGSISVGYDSAVGSSATTYSSPVQNTPTSISSSIADAGVFSSPPSWASSPPTSPDSQHTSVNYIPEVNPIQRSKTTTFASGPAISGNTMPTMHSPVLQKVSFTSAQELQKSKPREEREPKLSTSISNIGNAVLRSKTAEFERMMKSDKKTTAPPTAVSTAATTAADREKKKYTKRRYTDSRHQTRHIPDSDSLETASVKKEEKSLTQAAGQVYKRRELISSVPSK